MKIIIILLVIWVTHLSNTHTAHGSLLPPLIPTLPTPTYPSPEEALETLLQQTADIRALIPADLIERAKIHDDIASRTWYNSTPFDFIVVGAGASGSVVASRLTENPSVRVLLLESGGSESVFTDVPAMDEINTILPSEASKYTTYLTEPQQYGGQGMPGKQVAIVVGTVMGGGSTINGMMYNRGGRNDFDGWAQDYGCSNWTYDEVLPFFIKSEDNTDQQVVNANPDYHGVCGPLVVSSLNTSNMASPYELVCNTLLSAYSQVDNGHYQPTDFNGPHPIGYSTAQRTIKDGRRLSTSAAYLEPFYKSRPNLQILTGATVVKVNFDGVTAIGVDFLWNGQLQTANVTREVILTAGAINTPKILLLSGVGPKDHLEEMGIQIVADLPVGKNFQDHVRVAGLNFNVDPIDYEYPLELLNLFNWLEFVDGKSGPLSNDVYLHQPAFLNVRTDVSNRSRLYGPSDLFIAPSLLLVPFVSLSFLQHQLSPEIVAEYYGPNFFQPQLNLYVTLNYVTSRGRVKLNSANYAVPPSVNPNYFSDPYGDDLARAVAGYRLGMELVNTTAFKNINARPFNTRVPGCTGNVDSDEYIQCVVKTLSASELHPCCSVRMGGDEPEIEACLDPRLNVRNVKGLRVADASVMPFAVTANTMAATIMIGEKAAHMILEDYDLLPQPFECENEGSFPDPYDCHQFHVCQASGISGEWIDHKFTCPSNTIWCEDKNQCGYPKDC